MGILGGAGSTGRKVRPKGHRPVRGILGEAGHKGQHVARTPHRHPKPKRGKTRRGKTPKAALRLAKTLDKQARERKERKRREAQLRKLLTIRTSTGPERALLDLVKSEGTKALGRSLPPGQRALAELVKRTVPKKVQKAAERELEGEGELVKAGQKAGEFLSKKDKPALVALGTLAFGPAGAAAAQKVKKPPQVFRNALREMGEIPATVIPSTYLFGAGVKEAAEGRPQRIKRLAKDLDESSAVVAAAKGDFKEAAKRAGERPVTTMLEISGGKALIGRGTGALLRATPGKGKVPKKLRKAGSVHGRPPKRLYPAELREGPTVERRYSKDSINKAGQVLGEKVARKLGREPGQARVRPSVGVAGRRGELITPALLRHVNRTVRGGEGVRRAARERVATESARQAPVTKRPPAARKARKGRVKLDRSARPVVRLIAEGVVRTPKTLRADLTKHVNRLREIELREGTEMSRPELRQLKGRIKAVEGVLANEKFLRDPSEAFRGAAEWAGAEAPRQVRLREVGAHSQESAKAKYIAPLVEHYPARRVVESEPTPALLRYKAAQRAEIEARREARRAEKRAASTRVHAARAEGGATVRVTQLDRATLMRDPEFLEARQALLGAQKELSKSNRELRAAERSGGAKVAERRMLARERVQDAKYRVAGARRDMKKVVAKIERDAEAAASRLARRDLPKEVTKRQKREAREVRDRASLGRKPTRSLQALERLRAKQGEAELMLTAAKEAVGGARKARVAARVPKGERKTPSGSVVVRTPHGWKQVDKLSEGEMRNLVRATGRDPDTIGFVSQRPHKGNPFYIPTMRGGKAPWPITRRRTGEAQRKGTSETSTKSLVEQAVESEGTAVALENFFDTLNKYATRGKEGFLPDWSTGTTAALELSTPKFRLTTVNVGALRGLGEQLEAVRKATPDAEIPAATREALSQKMQRAFEDGGKGKYALIPEQVKRELLAQATPMDNVLKIINGINTQWKRVILTTAALPGWLTGNIADVGVRSIHEGLTPLGKFRGHKIMEARERIDPRRAEQFREEALGGGFWHSNRMMEFLHPSLIGNVPGLRALSKAWEQWYGNVYRLEGKIEREPLYAVLGKEARADIKRSFKSLRHFLKIADEQIEAYALKLDRSPAKEARLSEQMELMIGNWGNRSAAYRKYLLSAAPFAQWLTVALRYVYITMPARHPIKTALYSAIVEMTDEERRKLGLTLHPRPGEPGLEDYLQSSIPVGNKLIRFAKYSSVGVATQIATEGLKGTLGFLIPPIKPLWQSLDGKDWLGRELKYPPGHPKDGQEMSNADRHKLGISLLAEGFLPFLSAGKRIRERGAAGHPTSTAISPKVWRPEDRKGGPEGLLEGLKRSQNPFRPLVPKYKEDRGKGRSRKKKSNVFLDGGGSNKNIFLK